MTSVFHPEGGYPRLFRYVPSGEMPSPDTLTLYDPVYNVIVINKDLYDKLDIGQKYLVERATTTLIIS